MRWRIWLRKLRRREPSLTECPDCGREMRLVERTTMTGNDMRTYSCDACRKEHIINFGEALWTLLSDARDKSG